MPLGSMRLWFGDDSDMSCNAHERLLLDEMLVRLLLAALKVPTFDGHLN